MTKTASELMKEAAAAIEQLRDEVDTAKAELMRHESAVKLAFELLHNGAISITSLESKIDELSSKPLSEQEIVKKGLEFSKVASARTSGFKLSMDTSYEDTRSPEERFNNFLLEDY